MRLTKALRKDVVAVLLIGAIGLAWAQQPAAGEEFVEPLRILLPIVKP